MNGFCPDPSIITRDSYSNRSPGFNANKRWGCRFGNGVLTRKQARMCSGVKIPLKFGHGMPIVWKRPSWRTNFIRKALL